MWDPQGAWGMGLQEAAAYLSEYCAATFGWVPVLVDMRAANTHGAGGAGLLDGGVE